MDNVRGSLFRLKKGIKHRLTGSKRKMDETRAGGHGGRVEPSGSLPRPEPHIVAGGDLQREGDEFSADDESVRPNAVVESKSDWKSTASASAKLVLRGVCDSADAFGPLKSVAGGLCFILENCEVQFPPHTLSVKLICTQAYEGEQASDRIVGAPGQNTCRTAL